VVSLKDDLLEKMERRLESLKRLIREKEEEEKEGEGGDHQQSEYYHHHHHHHHHYPSIFVLVCLSYLLAVIAPPLSLLPPFSLNPLSSTYPVVVLILLFLIFFEWMWLHGRTRICLWSNGYDSTRRGGQ